MKPEIHSLKKMPSTLTTATADPSSQNYISFIIRNKLILLI